MRRVLGVDIDGVITEEGDGEDNIWHLEMRKWFGDIEKIADAYEFDTAYGLSRTEVTEFFEARAEAIFEAVGVRPGCREVLESVRDLGVEIVLITAREACYSDVTKRWLRSHHIPYDRLIHAKDKAPVCRSLGVDLLIDDHVDNCEAVINEGILALCFTMDHNIRLKTRAPRVSSWQEIADYLASFYGEESLAV